MIGRLPEPDRKLAAIMVTDVVGFSRMMGADEIGTLDRYDRARRLVIDPAIAAHRGRVFKVMGDGLLVEFGSVVLALRAALAIQAELPGHAAPSPGQRIVLRIGVHQGDVVVQGTDLLGDGVNVAARLEKLAPPGGICMSARVREDAAGKIPLLVEDGGERSLKNLSQPMRVFLVRPPDPPRPAPPILGGASRTLVAVMPFAGGGDGTQAFAAALLASLVPALSRRPGLLAAPAAIKDDRGEDPMQLAVRAAYSIGASCTLAGAVRREGGSLHTVLRLLDVGTEQLVWQGRDEVPATDPPALDALADRLATAIGEQLRPGQVSAGPPALIAEPFRTPRLVLIETAEPGPALGHALMLEPARMVIGRQPPSDLVLPGSQVSRAHCQVQLDGDALTVTDLRSTNGTFVNGERITAPTRLLPGAVLKVGPYVMQFLLGHVLDGADPEATVMT